MMYMFVNSPLQIYMNKNMQLMVYSLFHSRSKRVHAGTHVL